MKLLRTCLALLAALWLLPQPIFAQTDEEEDRGYLQALLEDNLSDVGRDIKILGFQGAFSSEATIDRITIADDDGIWLTMNDIVMEWTRSSLLRGAVNINTLSAAEIILERRPTPVGGAPAPEASGFSLPELPVSLSIGEVRADVVAIEAPVFGERAIFQLLGSAELSGGEGNAALDIRRIDGAFGELVLNGSYNNESRQLELAMKLDESQDGIASHLLGLPGTPSVSLSVDGSGPLSDFVADIDLATDGQERLAGQVELLETRDDDASTNEETVMKREFKAALSGDIAPVFLPEHRDFFGNNISLTAQGQRFADGALDLQSLDLKTKALALSGEVALSPDYWPEKFKLVGRIGSDTGAPVLLPFSGDNTKVDTVDLNIEYDANQGDAWRGEFVVNSVARNDLTLANATLEASGILQHGDGFAVGEVRGDVHLDVTGIAPKSEDLARALGPALSGKLSFDWQEDGHLQLSDLDLAGTEYQLRGGLTADDLENGIIVNTLGDVELIAQDITQFAGLAGMPLTGAVKVALDGRVNLLGGAFDLNITGDGSDLGIGQKQFDPLITGDSSLDIKAVRDETGTRLERLNITTNQANASLTAELKTDASQAAFDLRVKDSAVIDAGLSGPAALGGTLVQSGDNWTLDADLSAPGGATASIETTLAIADGQLGLMAGSIDAKLANLSSYASLVGQPISGGVTANATGTYDFASGAFNAEVKGEGASLGIGQASVDPLLRGASEFMARIHREDGDAATQVIFLDALSVTTPELNVQATGTSNDGRNSLDFNAKLRNLGLVAEGISGPASATGTATLDGDAWQVAVQAEGPGGSNSTVNGSVQSDFSAANLALVGSAPLELTNSFIKPRLLTGLARFDLTLIGPLAVSSLSGNVQTNGARLALPTFQQALVIDQATAVLSGGQANVNVAASVVTGGRVTAQGQVGLAAPYVADMQIDVDQVQLTDGRLYETSLDGAGTLIGALGGGATLRADLTIGRTEIRISDVPASTVPILEELRHINEPNAVRQTRVFAGLIVEQNTAPTSARPYPIDITLRAPSQIFVRGRGLDAELGGTLRLSGTSANVIPTGQFDLTRGRLDILGKRLTLTEGRVVMRGAFDPYLSFTATSQTDEILVNVNVIGPVSAPEVTFTSSPDLPQDEVLARLLFGRNIAEISALQALQLALAVRTLAGKGGDGIIGNLRQNFALDDLDLTTDDDGEASLRVGKYISENIYTDVIVGSDGDTEINLNLNITPNLTARGTLGADGESSVGVFFERDY